MLNRLPVLLVLLIVLLLHIYHADAEQHVEEVLQKASGRAQTDSLESYVNPYLVGSGQSLASISTILCGGTRIVEDGSNFPLSSV
jgi:hypothetical protein